MEKKLKIMIWIAILYILINLSIITYKTTQYDKRCTPKRYPVFKEVCSATKVIKECDWTDYPAQ
tara:strand:- start:321 stop:512 length:192 start_codon:yes stop_codon:yes gene_type:complete